MTAPRAVLVGISAEWRSLNTIAWAARYAEKIDAPLDIAVAIPDIRDTPMAIRVADAAVSATRARFPRLAVKQSLCPDTLADTIMALSGTSQLIVLTQDLARHPTTIDIAVRVACPLAAVPPTFGWDMDDRPIVVGADGTEYSEPALRWAFTEAERIGTAIRVVHCSPHTTSSPLRLERAMTMLRSEFPAVTVQFRNLTCAPIDALAWHSQFAAMVVIGYGQHPVAGRVERAVLRRAVCPVVIVGHHLVMGVVPMVTPALETLRSRL